jgi:hypothetical protein
MSVPYSLHANLHRFSLKALAPLPTYSGVLVICLKPLTFASVSNADASACITTAGLSLDILNSDEMVLLTAGSASMILSRMPELHGSYIQLPTGT